MDWTKRLLRLLVIVILLAAVGIAGTGTYLVRRAFPITSGRLKVPGLRASVEVIRDRWGVPHVFAQNAHDLILAQGYVHAQDRLWQMEFNRRAADGRLSEIFGEATLDPDRFLRTIGLRRAAEAEAARQDPETQELLDAYAAGVNAFIAQHRGSLPIEFTLLGFRPDPWTAVDSLAFAKLMAWVLGANWETELLRAHLVSRFGPEGAQLLMPPYPDDAPVIVPPGARDASWQAGALLKLLRFAPGVPGLGSNNWVVGGARTATGTPILANDPHLDAAMPSVWYEMHLSGGPYNVSGVTFPGTAGVVLGHNEHIAWGVTNAASDVQDLYAERFDPADPTRYLYQGQWIPATVVQEAIAVKGRAEPVIETVRITRHGPIINSVVEGLDAFLAFRWTALQPGTIATAVLHLGRATSWDEFRDALGLWTVPAQNFVFADRKGNIGYQLAGRIPIRSRGDGLLPVPGWTGEYEWTGDVPHERLPSAFNPARGYLVTANNRVTPGGYPYLISREWDPGFRARRIESLLTAAPRLTVADMERIQSDVTSLPGQTIVRALAGVRIPAGPAADLLGELRAWDGVLSAGSRGGAIYEAFRIALAAQIFRPVLGPDLYARYLEHPDAWQLAMMRLLSEPGSPWWGPGGRDAAVATALAAANNTLTRRLGTDRTRWTWGRLHVMRFTHPIGQIPALGWVFNATAPAVGGDGYTVNNAAFDPKTFTQVVVASYRQIIDLGDWDRSLAIHTTGQSGLPFHQHYRDFVPLWATGTYHPMAFTRARIAQDAAATLTLTPP